MSAENTINHDCDPTKHAESNLVSLAAEKLDAQTLAESILYTSTEPCSMCTGTIYWSGVRTVVFGCSVQTLEALAGKSISISCREIFERAAKRVEVIGPVLENEAIAVHQNFWNGKSR